jgi:glycerol-3-phosphate acyltransferase PlsY
LAALNLALIALVAYLLGAIPTAIIMGKALKGIDIRKHGSGNAGGTNVFRVLGWKPGVAVILIDMLKGLAATIFAAKIVFTGLPVEQVYLQLLAGISAIFGHIWTVFAGFRGGKGVGTAAGMIFALFPIAATICTAIFLVVAFSTRYVSLASITAAIALPIVLTGLSGFFAMTPPPPLFALSILLAILIVFTHRSNIKRLLSGTENRFGEKRVS